MVRGYQKRVIHLRSTDSSVFEEAFFIVKDQDKMKAVPEQDMVREANRILADNLTVGQFCARARGKWRPRLGEVLGFLAGALASAAVFFWL